MGASDPGRQFRLAAEKPPLDHRCGHVPVPPDPDFRGKLGPIIEDLGPLDQIRREFAKMHLAISHQQSGRLLRRSTVKNMFHPRPDRRDDPAWEANNPGLENMRKALLSAFAGAAGYQPS